MKNVFSILVFTFVAAQSHGQDLKLFNAYGTTTPTGGGNLTTVGLSFAFQDLNGDSVLQTNEILYFPGTVIWVNNFSDNYIYGEIVGTPAIDGISASSGFDTSVDEPCCWWFTGEKVAEPNGVDGWYPSRWENYSISDIAVPQCENPVTIEEVIQNLESGFSIDPANPDTLTPIWNASTGESVRGFVDMEEPQTYSIQCEDDHFAVYVWFAGSGTAADPIQSVADFRDSYDLSLTIDGLPVGIADYDPYVGISPYSLGQRGILKVAAIIEPGDLTPGPHIAEMSLAFMGGDAGSFRVGFYVIANTPESLVSSLIDQVEHLNINAGISNAFDSKLQNAVSALDLAQSGDANAAVQLLQAFINSVEAQMDKAITADQGAKLISIAETAIERIKSS